MNNTITKLYLGIIEAIRSFNLSVKGLNPVGGNEAEKALQKLLWIGIVINAANSAVAPVVKIFMYSGLDQQLLAFCLLADSFIVFVIKTTVTEKTLPWIRRHFILLVFADAIIFICINVFFGHEPNIRKLAITFLCPIAGQLVSVMFNDLVNHLFPDATKLTVAEQKFDSANRLAFIIGGLLAVCTVVTNIEVALAVQCIVVLMDVAMCMGITRGLMHLCFDKNGNEIKRG